MAITNHERVGKAMELLKDGLGSFVERELKNAYKDKAASQALRYVGDDKLLAKKALTDWDAAALLRLMWEAWNDVFATPWGKPNGHWSANCVMCATSGRISSRFRATMLIGRWTPPSDC